MRDWTKTLLPASFRGIRFFVEREDLAGGRRAAVHEFAGGETSVIEDQGRRTRIFDVTAYVTSDLVDVRAHALANALDAPGPGMLVLPIDGGQMVHVLEWRRMRERDRNGFIAIDFRAVVPRPGTAAGLTIGDVGAAFSNGLSLVKSVFGGLF
ncbi:DNA circularization N-terminal domain-containing protein [Mycoplana ramosa]|uniref:DNA circularization N-terminal domain-containing protein n=1 Tax=Mycoplana ramosa TaxID=40837 RepID=A0ABW3YWI4_MYCRA